MWGLLKFIFTAALLVGVPYAGYVGYQKWQDGQRVDVYWSDTEAAPTLVGHFTSEGVLRQTKEGLVDVNGTKEATVVEKYIDKRGVKMMQELIMSADTLTSTCDEERRKTGARMQYAYDGKTLELYANCKLHEQGMSVDHTALIQGFSRQFGKTPWGLGPEERE